MNVLILLTLLLLLHAVKCYCNVAYILLLLQQEIITLNDPDLKRDVMLMVGLQDLIEQYQVIITKHLVMT